MLTEDFYILYLTARPRPLLDRTRRWLADQGFPPGPVVTAPRLRDTIRQVNFKRKMLADMRTRCPNLRIGIGDRDADARAYGANRMLSLIVNRSLDQCSPHAIVLPDWSAVAEFFTANHDTLTQPDRLTEASDGRRMLLQPVVPWQGAD